MNRVVLSLLLISNVVLGQQENLRQAVIDQEPSTSALKAYTSQSVYPQPNNATVNWVLVDSMTNIFGYYSEEIHPLYYSPRANITTLVLRGDVTSYAPSSGAIYYTLSSDGGSTWVRCGLPFNCQTFFDTCLGRYPSGSIYYNSTVNNYYQIVAWPNLTSSGFGDLGYGSDYPLGGCAPFSTQVISGGYGSAMPTWSSTQMAFWAAPITGGVQIWSTPDFASPTYTTISGINVVNQYGGDAISVGSYTVIAYAFSGTVGISSLAIRVIYSTDQGTTWSAPDSVNLAALPGIGDYRTLWSWSGSSFHTPGHMVLDSLGYPHVVCGLQQEPSGEAGDNVVIAEIYKQGAGYPADPGTWTGKIISTANPSTAYLGGQVGFMPRIARNEEGTFFAAQWIDSKQANGMADLFVSGRYWKAQNWKGPYNITNSPTTPEYLAHFSPRMRRDGDSLFTVFSTYALPNGGGEPLPLLRTRIWVGTYQLNLTPYNFDYRVNTFISPSNGFVIHSYDTLSGFQVSFQNAGEQAQTDSFDVKYQISKGNMVYYENIQRISGLALNETRTITFSGNFITPDTGVFTLRAINLAGDENNANDTLVGFLTVSTNALVSPFTNIAQRWNLISLPVRRTNTAVSSVFPTAVAGTTFQYSGGYQSAESLIVGKGYWTKFPEDTLQLVGGLPVTSTTIEVTEGWNLLGSISYPVAVSTITSNPGSIVSSQFYGYEQGYIIADTISPGKGYWVKVNQNGQLILSSMTMANAQNRIRIIPTSELPPSPPEELSEEKKIPKEFALRQNYPNPFNPTTRFTVELPKDAHVELVVYNLLGQKVATLLNEIKPAGYYTVVWEGQNEHDNNMPSGIYFVKMVSEKFSSVKKIMLIK
jgi:hypothetical protein